jgi:hypothetical protein
LPCERDLRDQLRANPIAASPAGGNPWSGDAADGEGGREPATFRFWLFPPASPAFVPEVGKQNTIPKDPSQQLICLKKVGAGEGIRTLDPDLGKVVLYP